MNIGLVAAAGVALCYGMATVLQSIGAKSTEEHEGLDPGLLVRLLRSGPYLLGLGLDGGGFALTVVALQTLPLFVVEAFTAGALAVTAVAAALWLKLPLSRAEWAAVAAVTVGLVAVGLSAGRTRRRSWRRGSSGSRWPPARCSSSSRTWPHAPPGGGVSPSSARSPDSASAWWGWRPGAWPSPPRSPGCSRTRRPTAWSWRGGVDPGPGHRTAARLGDPGNRRHGRGRDRHPLHHRARLAGRPHPAGIRSGRAGGMLVAIAGSVALSRLGEIPADDEGQPTAEESPAD